MQSIGKALVTNSLKKFVEKGFIQRHGKGKATIYTRIDERVRDNVESLADRHCPVHILWKRITGMVVQVKLVTDEER